jgi:hypothetical protein
MVLMPDSGPGKPGFHSHINTYPSTSEGCLGLSVAMVWVLRLGHLLRPTEITIETSTCAFRIERALADAGRPFVISGLPCLSDDQQEASAAPVGSLLPYSAP